MSHYAEKKSSVIEGRTDGPTDIVYIIFMSCGLDSHKAQMTRDKFIHLELDLEKPTQSKFLIDSNGLKCSIGYGIGTSDIGYAFRHRWSTVAAYSLPPIEHLNLYWIRCIIVKEVKCFIFTSWMTAYFKTPFAIVQGN